MLGQYTLGMELNADDRKGSMAHSHDCAVVEGCRNLQGIRKTLAFDDEGVVASRFERGREAVEDAAPIVMDRGSAPVNRRASDDSAAERLADSLVPETDAEGCPYARSP